MRLPYRKRVLIHLDTGRSFEGVLVNRRGEFVSLQGASYEAKAENAMRPADGIVLLPKARIEWVQAL